MSDPYVGPIGLCNQLMQIILQHQPFASGHRIEPAFATRGLEVLIFILILLLIVFLIVIFLLIFLLFGCCQASLNCAAARSILDSWFRAKLPGPFGQL